MKKFLKVAGIATLVVVIGAAIVAGIALAQEPTPTPGARPFWGHGFGMWGKGGWGNFDAAAEALGLTPEQLFSELHAGKTLADVAQEKGVDLQAVQAAVAAARQEAMRQAIEQAVTDGKIGREQADWMLKGIENGWMGGRSFRGHGFRPWGVKPGAQDRPEGSLFEGRLAMPGQSL